MDVNCTIHVQLRTVRSREATLAQMYQQEVLGLQVVHGPHQGCARHQEQFQELPMESPTALRMGAMGCPRSSLRCRPCLKAGPRPLCLSLAYMRATARHCGAITHHIC